VHIGAGAGRRRGRYVLGDLLGRGGMAEVFAGQALGSHGFAKPVAIKRLLPEHTNDLAYVDRLIDEANLLVAMTHGNVVSVLDLVREGDDVFLVMEFVDGPSLRQLLHARTGCKLGPLPLGVSTYVVHAAATGLEFAHARPGGAVIHADISPSNLLLTTSGEVKVADFGIARREGVGSGGVVEGKWAYMAPEQARGEPLSACADVFALGVVLYELITGVHPFARKVSATGRDETASHSVVPPRVVRPEIPAALDAICMQAIAHDPARRLPRMQLLADALSELRFANGWRDAASELAQTIRDARAGRRVPRSSGDVKHPVTIITRSLLGTTSDSASGGGGEAVVEGAVVPEQQPRADGTPPRGRRPSTGGALAAGTGRGAPQGSAEIPARTAADAAAAAGMTIDVSMARAASGTPARHPRWSIAMIALVVCLGFGGIAAATWKMLATGPTPAAVQAPASLPPAQTALTVEPVEPPPPPAPAVEPAPAVAPVVAAEIVTEAVAAKDTAKPAPVRSGRNAGKKPAKPVAKPAADKPAAKQTGTGTLRVSSVPWAYVTVDGKTFETPHRFELAAGTYTVKLHSPDTGQRQTRKVTIGEGQVETLAVKMGAAE
jgi:serine/threonine protein kinase